MTTLSEPLVVTIPGWCARCFQPCRVELGVNEPLCTPCEKATALDIRRGIRGRSAPRRRRRAA